jgi:hypothetical protein
MVEWQAALRVVGVTWGQDAPFPGKIPVLFGLLSFWQCCAMVNASVIVMN